MAQVSLEFNDSVPYMVQETNSETVKLRIVESEIVNLDWKVKLENGQNFIFKDFKLQMDEQMKGFMCASNRQEG